jgi:hypothetical protein
LVVATSWLSNLDAAGGKQKQQNNTGCCLLAIESACT